MENPQLIREENGDYERHEYRPRRLELPVFGGDDPPAWIFRAKRYFWVNEVPEAKKLASAVVCLEGAALGWYQWRDKRQPFQGWRDFLHALRQRFKAPQEGSPHERLMELKQEGSVASYRANFELLSAPLDDVTDAVLLGCFVSGLRLDIKPEVRADNPRD